jgi:hypothetical protein
MAVVDFRRGGAARRGGRENGEVRRMESVIA